MAYFVFLRRNCLVGGLCDSVLGFLDLWLPVDGNVVDIYIYYKLFFIGQGVTRLLNRVLSNFR